MLKDALSKNRDFAALWAANSISQFGTMLGALGLTALVYLNATPAQMGLLAAAMSAPVLLLSLFAGVWVDRLPRRAVMVFADYGRFVLLLSIPAVAVLGSLQIEQLYAVAFCTGALDVLFDLAYRSVLPSLVPPDRLVDANSSLQMSESVAESVSPAVGGGLVQAVGGPGAVLFDAITFAASGLLISTTSTNPRAEPEAASRSAFAESLEGFQAVWRQPVLRAILSMVACYSFFGGFFLALYGVLAIRELSFSPLVLGVLVGAGGVGSIVASLTTGRITRRFGLGRSVLGAYIPAALMTVMIPLAGGPAWLAFGLLLFDQFFGDILWSVHNISALSLRQAVAPPAQLGRVNATFLLASHGLRPLGALVAGVLADIIGIREALLIAVAGINAAGLWLIFSPLGRMKPAPADGSAETN